MFLCTCLRRHPSLTPPALPSQHRLSTPPEACASARTAAAGPFTLFPSVSSHTAWRQPWWSLVAAFQPTAWWLDLLPSWLDLVSNPGSGAVPRRSVLGFLLWFPGREWCAAGVTTGGEAGVWHSPCSVVCVGGPKGGGSSPSIGFHGWGGGRGRGFCWGGTGSGRYSARSSPIASPLPISIS